MGGVAALSLGMKPALADERCTITVPEDYDTIQNAIDAANAGDTICVEPGARSGAWVVTVNTENLTIESIVPHEVSVPHWWVTADGVTITGFRSGSGGLSPAAVTLRESSNHVITNNIIRDGGTVGGGVSGNSDNTIVSHNDIVANRGISVGEACEITHNVVEGVRRGTGIRTESGSTVAQNTVSGTAEQGLLNSAFRPGIEITGSDVNVHQNTVEDNWVGIRVNGTGSHKVQNNTVRNTVDSVMIVESNNNHIGPRNTICGSGTYEVEGYDADPFDLYLTGDNNDIGPQNQFDTVEDEGTGNRLWRNRSC